MNREIKKNTSKLSWLVGIFLVATNIFAWRVYLNEEHSKIEKIFEVQGLRIQSELASKLKTKLLALNRMADRWNALGGTDRKVWEEDAKSYVEDQPGYQAIEWVDESYHVRWIVPFVGNEKAQDLNLAFEENRRLALEQSKLTGEIGITKNVNLVQGGKGFLVFNPLYVKNDFQGFILGVFRYRQLFDSFLGDEFKNQFDISLQEQDQELYKYGTEKLSDNSKYVQLREIDLFGAKWKLKIWPTEACLAQFKSPLVYPGFVSGLLFSILFSLSIYLVQNFYLSKSQLEVLNEELEIKNKETLKSVEIAQEAEHSAKKAQEIEKQRSQELDDLRRSALNIAQDAEKLRIQAELAGERNRAILNTAVDGIITIDEKGIIQSFNPAAEALFGYREDEMVGKNVNQLMPAPFHEEHDGYLASYLKTGVQKIIGKDREVVGKRKNNSTFPMHLSVGEMLLDNKPFFTGIARDITTQKELINELKRTNEELEKFAYISSHDLKAPLRAIDELSKWIEQDTQDILPKESQNDLQMLRKRVNRMRTLIDDLLHYSRLGSQKYDNETVDVKKMLESIIELLDPPEGFQIIVTENITSFETVEPPLHQVFINLIGNAIKHHENPQNGVIRINYQNREKFHEFSIADNGSGIDPKKHDKVFEMFSTLKPRDVVEGSGMGLAFIDKILRTVGGSIKLESEKGKGATFTFEWPKTIN